MRRPEDEVVRYREEVKLLQGQLARAKDKRIIIHGIPEKEHAKIVAGLQYEIDTLKAKANAGVPKAEHDKIVTRLEVNADTLRRRIETDNARHAKELARERAARIAAESRPIPEPPDLGRLKKKIDIVTKQREQLSSLLKRIKLDAAEAANKQAATICQLKNRLRRYDYKN